MSDNAKRPTSQHVASTATYGIGMSKNAVDQMSSSANAAKEKRRALEKAREAKKAAEERNVQRDMDKNK